MKARHDMSNDRDKALEMALAQIDKQYGKGSIMRMGDKTNWTSR
jgi:recombination protein RecA